MPQSTTTREILLISGVTATVSNPILSHSSIVPATSLMTDLSILGGHTIDDISFFDNNDLFGLTQELRYKPGWWVAVLSDTSPSKNYISLTTEDHDRFLAAVRLYNKNHAQYIGRIILNLPCSPSDIPTFYPINLFSGEPPSIDLLPLATTVQFDRLQWRGIQRIYESLASNVLKDKLQFDEALHRFSQSYETEPFWENITKLTIALEALLGIGGTSGELSYRLSMRSSLLLALPFSEVGQIYKTVRGMYAIRSAVAHGDRRQLNKEIAKLSGITQKTPSHEIAVPDLRGASKITVPEDYDRWFIGVERARHVVRLAILACITLASSSQKNYKWPFSNKLDLDEELLISERLRLWRKMAGVTERDRTRLWMCKISVKI